MVRVSDTWTAITRWFQRIFLRVLLKLCITFEQWNSLQVEILLKRKKETWLNRIQDIVDHYGK